MKTAVTSKGTALPLLNLKGKEYLQVAHRLQWLNEDCPRFNINTEYILLTEEQTIVRATVQLFDQNGTLVKSTSATKRETKKDFSDHTEKAETAAIGRALAILGFGTQMALSDLDEGDRIVDSPVADVKQPSTKQAPTAAVLEKKTPASFKRTPAVPSTNGAASNAASTASASEGWD